MKIKSAVNFIKPVIWKSKIGRITFVFPFFKRRIKIYQAENSTQAAFIKRAISLPDLSRYFHPILFSFGRYLFAGWVEGISSEKIADIEKFRLLDWIVDFQSSLHSRSLCVKDEQGGFDYLNYLEKRIVKFAPPGLDLDEIGRLRMVASSPPVEKSGLSHPDVTLRNIVIEKDNGNFRIIDNELLSQSPYFLLDIYNTCYSLYPSKELISYYLNRYASCMIRFSLQPGWESSLAAAWSLRIAGSHFQAGKFQKGIEALEHWDESNLEIIEMIKNSQIYHNKALSKAVME